MKKLTNDNMNYIASGNTLQNAALRWFLQFG